MHLSITRDLGEHACTSRNQGEHAFWCIMRNQGKHASWCITRDLGEHACTSRNQGEHAFWCIMRNPGKHASWCITRDLGEHACTSRNQGEHAFWCIMRNQGKHASWYYKGSERTDILILQGTTVNMHLLITSYASITRDDWCYVKNDKEFWQSRTKKYGEKLLFYFFKHIAVAKKKNK